MIRPVLFRSFGDGVIKEEPYNLPGCFLILKKFPLLYEAYRSKHPDICPFYGHPDTDSPQKMYLGTDREGVDGFSDELKKPRDFREEQLITRMENDVPLTVERELETVFAMLKHPEQYERMHVRIAGTNLLYPEDYAFLGYDVSYEARTGSAFSIICDCLFLPQWHGCDEDGTLFSDDYAKLNENGLFSNWDDAYAYLVKYRNEDWSEMGWFGIYKVRRRKADDQ